MKYFHVETNSTPVKPANKSELIKQIESLQRFYYDIGYDTDNVKTIFSLTLSYLRGQVNKMIVRSFFDVLMTQNKLETGKEVNLLNCFDELIEDCELAKSLAGTTDIRESSLKGSRKLKPIQLQIPNLGSQAA